MQTRQEAIQYCHLFQDVYEDYPFHDDNWCIRKIKKYADWISEATGFSCVETQKAVIGDIVKYDTIILGGGIYASGIAGLLFLKKNIKQLSNKKIIVFCCGASPYEESAFQQIKSFNMKDALTNIPLFYCRGSWDMASMSFKDRTLCTMLRKAVSKKNPDDYEIWEKFLIARSIYEVEYSKEQVSERDRHLRNLRII